MLHQLSIWYNLILSSLNNIVLIWSANTYKDTIYSYFTVQILEKYGLNSGREEIGKWYPYLGNRVLVICDIAYIVILRATGNNSFTGSSNLNSQFILRQIWPWMIRHSLWSFSYTIPHTSLNPLLLNQVTTYYWMYVSREHWGVGGGFTVAYSKTNHHSSIQHKWSMYELPRQHHFYWGYIFMKDFQITKWRTRTITNSPISWYHPSPQPSKSPIHTRIRRNLGIH